MRASNITSLGFIDGSAIAVTLLGFNLYEPIAVFGYVELISDVSRWIELESDVVRTIELISDVTRTIELESDVIRNIELVDSIGPQSVIDLIETRDYSKR